MEVGAAPERRSSGQFSSTSSPRLGEVLVWWGSRSPGIEKGIHKTPACSRHQSKAVTGQPFSFLLQRRSGKKSLTSSTKRDRPKPSTRGQVFSPPPTFPPSSHMAVRLQCGKGEPGEACPHFQHQAASWSSSTAVMKGRRRGANCAEICSIDVGENEPIDPQRKKCRNRNCKSDCPDEQLNSGQPLHQHGFFCSFLLPSCKLGQYSCIDVF